MADGSQYTPSGVSRNQEHHENRAPTHWREDTDWLRLGDVVAGLRARVERAIADRDETAGAAAHEDLISAEWRLRQAGRRRT